MRNFMSILLTALLVAGTPLSVAAQESADTQPESGQRDITVPGKGSPDATSGRSSLPTPAATQAGLQGTTLSDEPAAADAQYPGRRGIGLGYPYDGMDWERYRSRGGGYGRGRRGYGYGYPGYRGHGGSPYPQHRQYGNPPFYPGRPAGNNPPTAQD